MLRGAEKKKFGFEEECCFRRRLEKKGRNSEMLKMWFKLLVLEAFFLFGADRWELD
jgi:hypothetical protein